MKLDNVDWHFLFGFGMSSILLSLLAVFLVVPSVSSTLSLADVAASVVDVAEVNGPAATNDVGCFLFRCLVKLAVAPPL